MKNVHLKFEVRVVRYMQSGKRFHITPSVFGQF
jgi:hypothetical protein